MNIVKWKMAAWLLWSYICFLSQGFNNLSNISLDLFKYFSSVGISSGSPSQNFWRKIEEIKGEDLEATKKPLKEKLHNIQMFVAFRTSEIESDLYKVHLSQKNSLLTNNTT